MKKIAIIQARMSSTRLPGKVLMPLAGEPVIRWVYDRACRIEGLDRVVVATTESPADQPLVDFCRRNDIPIHRGSEQNVLDRFWQVTRQEGAEIVVRITADCPLLDPRRSGLVLARLLSDPGLDYVNNTDPPTLPDGLDTEAFRAAALHKAWRLADDDPSREHVTWYIRQHPREFKLATVRNEIDFSAHRWTLDERADAEFLEAVTAELRQRGQFGYLEEVLALLAERPELLEINSGIERNEGLRKSLETWKNKAHA